MSRELLRKTSGYFLGSAPNELLAVLCLRRRRGPWAGAYPHRSVDEAAVESLPGGIDTRVSWQARGLLMFQEDLMAILSRFGGLDPIDAYQLVSSMALHQAEKVRKGE